MLAKQMIFVERLVAGVCFAGIVFPQSQTFSSGSTGADGVLNITTPGITYFSPQALGLNPQIPNVFNFTTVSVAKGAELILSEEVFHGPVYFLASGNVDIEGLLVLNGGSGGGGTANQSDRTLTYAGSGGYGGGLGGEGGLPAESGNGPGGGMPGTLTNADGVDGVFTGSQYLVPLVGGSGGGGAYQASSNNCFGSTGGAGGGAILIASSTTITVNGVIAADGGPEVDGSCSTASGGGSGGAIRLVANTINGTGAISATGGGNSSSGGRIRLEAFQQSFQGVYNNSSDLQAPASVLFSTPYSLALPTTGPSSLTVTSINGIAINANPFSFPDATINTSSPITIAVQSQYIPPGTVPKIYISSETGPDQVISCSALAGTLQLSTCNAQVTLPSGGSRGFVKATW